MMKKIQGRIFGRAPPTSHVSCSFRSTRSNIRGAWQSRHVPTAAKDARDPSSAGGAHAHEDRAQSDTGHGNIVLSHGDHPTVPRER